MKNFIEASELKKIENYILIDLRQNMQDSKYGIEAYKKSHIEGAYYFSLEKDLASEAKEVGGKHPFPELNEFQMKLRKTGMKKDSLVILYDDGDNASAGRMWFLLKYFGINNVKVVKGGYNKLVEAGFKVTSKIPTDKNSDLKLEKNDRMISSYEEVLNYSKKPSDGQVLIDSRSYERYLGNIEPLYKVAGHIPHAINYDYTENFSNGEIKDTEELRQRFNKLENISDIIVSCGSGVTACSNIMAMDEVGLKTRLFIGSYSEWTDRGNEVAKGLETIENYNKSK